MTSSEAGQILRKSQWFESKYAKEKSWIISQYKKNIFKVEFEDGKKIEINNFLIIKTKQHDQNFKKWEDRRGELFCGFSFNINDGIPEIDEGHYSNIKYTKCKHGLSKKICSLCLGYPQSYSTGSGAQIIHPNTFYNIWGHRPSYNGPKMNFEEDYWDKK